jgi:acetate kinase
MKMDMLLVLNSGSTSVKFALYEPQETAQPRQLIRGALDTSAHPVVLHLKALNGAVESPAFVESAAGGDPASFTQYLIDWSQKRFPKHSLRAVAHRVVHGGQNHRTAEAVSVQLIAELEMLTPLAPLHQPANLAPIKEIAAARPDLFQVACFDTGFHLEQPALMQMVGLPRRYFERGLRKMGFHGLSYEYVAGRFADLDGAMPERMVAAHLGGGASVCGMRAGISVSSSMGMTALDGLVMATRCGSIDPGLVLYLLDTEKLSTTQLRDMLYRESGLLGVSGVSGDMRVLTASRQESAAQAVALFVQRAAREIAATATDLGGMDALVFTGGVGENQATVRAAICDKLAWLGVRLTQGQRQSQPDMTQDRLISSGDSAVQVWVIHTDEESVMARAAARLLESRRLRAASAQLDLRQPS